MDEIRTKLEAELRQAVRRLRQMGGAVAAEDLPGAIGDNSPFADEVDEIQANESRELGFATRTLLVERVNRLADALERLNEGEYGVCVECSEPIPPRGFGRCPRCRPASGARTGSSGSSGGWSRSARCSARRPRKRPRRTGDGTAGRPGGR